ncbi:MAG: TonB-dependent receptor plug domain-containing protein [Campylobacter sp.]
MRDIIGVYVRGTNSMNQKIFIRGISDRGLNITVDGAKQMGNTFHHNADLLIDPELLKSVEVAVGAKSAISGGIGGSVAFRTVDAKDLLENGEIIGAKIKSGYASNNDEFSQSLLIYSAPIDGLNILAAINRKRYDWGKSGNDMKMGGDGSDLNYLFKVGYNFFDAHKIAVSHEKNTYKGIFPMRAEFSSWLSDKNSVAWRKYERVTSTLKYEYNPSDLLNLQAVAYNTDHKRVEKSKWGIKTNGLNLNSTTKFQTADLTHTLRYGTEFYTSENYISRAICVLKRHKIMRFMFKIL